MEPVSLTVAAIVAMIAAKASDRAADAAVDGGESVLRRIAARVRRRFGDEDDEQASGVLELVEQAPDSKLLTARLADAIDNHVTASPEFGDELAQLVSQAQRSGVDAGQITQLMVGDQGVQIAAPSDSQITITHNAPAKPPSSGVDWDIVLCTVTITGTEGWANFAAQRAIRLAWLMDETRILGRSRRR